MFTSLVRWALKAFQIKTLFFFSLLFHTFSSQSFTQSSSIQPFHFSLTSKWLANFTHLERFYLLKFSAGGNLPPCANIIPKGIFYLYSQSLHQNSFFTFFVTILFVRKLKITRSPPKFLIWSQVKRYFCFTTIIYSCKSKMLFSSSCNSFCVILFFLSHTQIKTIHKSSAPTYWSIKFRWIYKRLFLPDVKLAAEYNFVS